MKTFTFRFFCIIFTMISILLIPTYSIAQQQLNYPTSDPNMHKLVLTGFQDLTIEGLTGEQYPRYWMFFEFGDGTFEEKFSDSFRVEYVPSAIISGEHGYDTDAGLRKNPRTLSTPIYSGSEPPVHTRMNQIPINNGSSFSPPSYFYVNDPEDALTVHGSFRSAMVAGDKYILALVFRNPIIKNTNSPLFGGNGSLELYWNQSESSFFTPTGEEFYRAYHGETLNSINNGLYNVNGREYSDRVIWDFAELTEESGEWVVFINLEIPSVDMIEGTEDIFLAAVLKETTSVAGQRAVDSTEIHIALRNSRDPNQISINPQVICPDIDIDTFMFTVDFQNEGAAPESEINVKAFFGPDWDLGSLEVISAIMANQTYTAADFPAFQINGEQNSIEWNWKLANLPGNPSLFGMEGSHISGGGLDESYSMGSFTFSLVSKTQPEECANLEAFAEIKFSGNTETINTRTITPECNCDDGRDADQDSVLLWWILILLAIALAAFIIWLIANES